MRRRRSLAASATIAMLALVVGCSGSDDQPPVGASAGPATTADRAPGRDDIEALTVEIVDRHPHDTDAFTEGLTFDQDGRLFESLGLEGASSIREVDPTTGEVIRESTLDPEQFGEGIAVGPYGIVQLTWKNEVAFVWTRDTLESRGTASYEGEGWGLTFDGTQFVQSDGSPTITRRNVDTFEPLGTFEVTRDGAPVDELNELEWVDGVLYANVWHSDEIMRIDPATGRVTGVIDGSDLWQDDDRTSEMTLNGIAHRPGDPADRLWLTGKNWPEIFEVKVVPR